MSLMEDFLHCEICTIQFNTQDRKPRLMRCGHSFCSICLKEFIQMNNRQCPFDNTQFEPSDTIESFSPNFQIIKYLDRYEIPCSNHPAKLATTLNLYLVEAYCEECSVDKQYLIQQDNITTELDKVLLNYLSQDIPEDLKTRISKPNSTNREKLSLVRDLKFTTDTIICNRHKMTEAAGFNLDTKEVLCGECIGNSGNSGNFVLINSPNAIEELLKKVLVIRRSGAVKIEGLLSEDIEQLKHVSLKVLLNEYQKLRLDFINTHMYLKQGRCSICRSLYELDNEPYILPCIGGHVICSRCKGKSDQITCPIDNKKINSADTEPFFTVFNRVPYCSYCDKPFNLYSKIPKELNCGHIICLSCLVDLHISPNPPLLKCSIRECAKQIENLKNLPSNKFLVFQITKNVIYCSRHRNRQAICIELCNFNSWCATCQVLATGEKLDFSDLSTGSVLEFLVNAFNEKSQKDLLNENPNEISGFKRLDFQEMIDKIRGLADPNSQDNLRSCIPKGRPLADKLDSRWENKSYLLRFFSVMPPVERSVKHEFITKPWVVDAGDKQVEAVVLLCKRNISLFGFIFGQVLNNNNVYYDMIKIVKGKKLDTEKNKVCSIETRNSFDKDGTIQTIKLPHCVNLEANEYYSVIFRICGQDIFLFRGNPFDLKEKVLGSDGTEFEFSEPEDLCGYELNGQHDINGPILGLIYDRLG